LAIAYLVKAEEGDGLFFNVGAIFFFDLRGRYGKADPAHRHPLLGKEFEADHTDDHPIFIYQGAATAKRRSPGARPSASRMVR